MASKKGREFETIIKLSGALDKSVLAAIDMVADNLDQLEAAARSAAGAAGEVAGRIQDQGKALAAAKTKYASYVLAGEESSEAAQKLAQQIIEQTADLRRNEAALRAAEQAAERLTAETIEAVDAASAMAETITDQSKALAAAKKQYAAYVLKGEEGSDAAQKLAREIATLSSDLKRNQAALKAAERAADSFADTSDEAADKTNDLNDAAKKAEKSLGVMDITLGNLVADGIETLIGKAADAAQSIYGLADSTRDYRKEAAKLETAARTAGASTDYIRGKWQDLTAVLGDEGAVTEGLNNLMAAGFTAEREMNQITRLFEGAAIKWKDTLKFEGLSDSLQEWIGSSGANLTGNFAELLERLGYTLEDVQEQTVGMTDKQRRMYAMSLLSASGLGTLSDEYRAQNADLIAADKATAAYNDRMAKLGERLEPITTAVNEGLAELVETAIKLTDDADLEPVIDGIGDAFDAAGDAIEWVAENGDILIPILGGLTAGMAAYKIAAIAAAIATGALSAPILLIIGLIAALVAGGIALYQNWDTVKAKAYELYEWLDNIWSNIDASVSGFIDRISERFPLLGSYMSGWWESICATVENGKAIFNDIIDFISNVFTGNWEAAWQNVVDIFANMFAGTVNFTAKPLAGIIKLLNTAIDGINSLGFTVPDWVPGIGGKRYSFNIPNIPDLPLLASGGFTRGVSIAGEAGTEAVISFDPLYRDENLSYWAEAGRLLGVDPAFTLTGEGGDSYYEMGGVTFAPNINIHGEADKQTIMEAIEAEYPEFLDMLEEWFRERGKPVYA